MLQLPRLGMINVHASLLPKYRGAAPVHRAVIDGETETGVTIMRMVDALDAGAMLAKVTRPIGADETSDVVERDLARLGVPPLLEVIEQLASRHRSGGAAGRFAVDVRAAADEGRRADRLDAAGAAPFTTACAACIPGRMRTRTSTARASSC